MIMERTWKEKLRESLGLNDKETPDKGKKKEKSSYQKRKDKLNRQKFYLNNREEILEKRREETRLEREAKGLPPSTRKKRVYTLIDSVDMEELEKKNPIGRPRKYTKSIIIEDEIKSLVEKITKQTSRDDVHKEHLVKAIQLMLKLDEDKNYILPIEEKRKFQLILGSFDNGKCMDKQDK